MTAPRRSGRAGIVVVGLLGAAVPGTARAHLNSTGMGPVYDGVMHFVTSPEDLVPVLALALLAGLRGAGQGRRTLLVLPTAWLVGGLAGLFASAATGSPFLSAAWFLLLGGLVATDTRLPLGATTALAALLGLQHGWQNGSGMGQLGAAFVALLGLSSSVFILAALGSALVVSLHARWTRVAVRVAGSWIAASGLLLLGWAARTR